MGNNRQQSIDDRITELRSQLQGLKRERRRRFIEACTYCALADPDTNGKGCDLGLDANDAAALDSALDVFSEISMMMANYQTELQDKQAILNIKQRALDSDR